MVVPGSCKRFTVLLRGASSLMNYLSRFQGITLILCAIRSMLWHRFRGFSHYIIHGMLIMSGVALSLLGCLDIGDQKVIVDSQGNIASQSPLFALLNAGVPLIPVFLTYLFTMLLSSVSRWPTLSYARRVATH